MALSNSQYNALMREYEKQQIKNRHEQERRIAQVYRRLPRIEEIDREIGAQSAACARKVLGGDGQARELLRAQLADLKEEKQALLKSAGFSVDYMEMRYRCMDCQDTGYANGKRCHCLERARIEILYAQSNLQEILKRENFSTFSFDYFDTQTKLPGLGLTQREYMEQVVRRCREFALRYPDKGKNILFTGSTGVGKTFLTNCIAKELIDRYVSVIYLSSSDLFELFSRFRFGRDEEEAQESCRHILECDMLIIDDLGTEVNNTFVSSQLFYCVNERINRGKGTMISTNLSMDMLRDLYSDRVASRIMSQYLAIPLYGADLRMKIRRKLQRFGD